MNAQPTGHHANNLHLGTFFKYKHTIGNTVLSMVPLRPLLVQAIDEWLRDYCSKIQVTNIGAPRIMDLHLSNNEAGEMRVYYAFVNWRLAERNIYSYGRDSYSRILNNNVRF